MKCKTASFPFFIFSLCLFLVSCKPATSGQDGAETETPAEAEKDAQTPASNEQKYPSLGNEEITQLYAAAEKLDMIFYELPISVNQDDPASAKNSVLYISPSPATINNSCKALGRMSWISDGVIIKEADIYADSICQYFIFMSNNQPVAANAMAESGVNFFKNVITQVQQRQ
jgi:hypothetical protein